jgi:hypothetical protein
MSATTLLSPSLRLAQTNNNQSARIQRPRRIPARIEVARCPAAVVAMAAATARDQIR